MKTKEMTKFLEKFIEQVMAFKTACKAQIVQVSNSSQPLPAMRSLKCCYETSEMCDLLMLFVANRSPSIRSCLTFAQNVITRCKKECSELIKDPCCNKTAKLCVDHGTKLLNMIKTFKANL
tara:strand:+ start:239 stop:601 length:363 start_codon:yes stop_codon:yes gene_type:complete